MYVTRTTVNNTLTNTGNMLAKWISGALNTHTHNVRTHIHFLDANNHFAMYMHIMLYTFNIYNFYFKKKKMKLPLWFQVD